MGAGKLLKLLLLYGGGWHCWGCVELVIEVIKYKYYLHVTTQCWTFKQAIYNFGQSERSEGFFSYETNLLFQFSIPLFLQTFISNVRAVYEEIFVFHISIYYMMVILGISIFKGSSIDNRVVSERFQPYRQYYVQQLPYWMQNWKNIWKLCCQPIID